MSGAADGVGAGSEGTRRRFDGVDEASAPAPVGGENSERRGGVRGNVTANATPDGKGGGRGPKCRREARQTAVDFMGVYGGSDDGSETTMEVASGGPW